LPWYVDTLSRNDRSKMEVLCLFQLDPSCDIGVGIENALDSQVAGTVKIGQPSVARRARIGRRVVTRYEYHPTSTTNSMQQSTSLPAPSRARQH
jgi:hypothetical protein